MAGTESISKNTNTGQSGGNDADESQCVVFRLFEEEFGVDINNVKEIVRLPDITPIPRTPDYISGICNLRGSVLPVIDTRTRFGLETQKATDQTRLLVVETPGGAQFSLVVDHVREVMRMKNSLMEPPPAVCKGVDKEFLSGVIKVDGGKRLVLMLNLSEVVDMEKKSSDTRSEGSSSRTEDKPGGDVSEEEQLVSFRVGSDEYAFDIKSVSEILKVMDITAVPNVPDYVLGMFTIRNHLLPILDMRRLLGLPDMITERKAMLDSARSEERKWADNLKHSIEAGIRFSGAMASSETMFGKWLDGYNTASVEVESLVKRIKRMRSELYASGRRAVEAGVKSRNMALDLCQTQLNPQLDVVLDLISGLKEAMAEHISEDQRAMVVECGEMTIGFLVDWVDEVLRIPRSIIDDTPAMATSERRELKAVAKLDGGERLIMIMDETSLVSGETSKLLAGMKVRSGTDKSTTEEASKSLAQETMDEEQLVTFSVDREEYGLRIMQVQEINRLADVTHVPRAPYFIDGMTNLRGNVIPVINIRKLFSLPDIEADDRTRIIIVDIGGSRTGLRVDAVNEVLRLSRKDIEPAPGIVTSEGAGRLMQGICKINNGKRMVVLIDASEMLDRKDLKTLRSLSGIEDTLKPAAKKVSAEKKKLEISE